ncbi:MAG: MotA/TolQ/ExbB proton channel family protein [Kiritimatiellaeota bacterium]|nr:MotA/TolQ/ExbB proton channel family protein [Kiritimatiellota bacterium]
MKKLVVMAVLSAGMLAGGLAYAQEDAVDGLAPAAGIESTTGGGQQKQKAAGFWDVVISGGWLSVLLWLALFGCGAAAVYFIVDSSVLIRPQKVMPQSLVANVKAAMGEGDVMKALKVCEVEPGPMANILTAGFSHVEEGFDVIQESISAAADLETERIMQKLTWISVCSNLSPMLGLLGTVQGMIMCFKSLATGAPDVGALALAISQALWTTAAGLSIAIPAITFYYSIRNNANRLILRMQAITMELIKDLRNIEIVND